jgi:hypothetical protein
MVMHGLSMTWSFNLYDSCIIASFKTFSQWHLSQKIQDKYSQNTALRVPMVPLHCTQGRQSDAPRNDINQ